MRRYGLILAAVLAVLGILGYAVFGKSDRNIATNHFENLPSAAERASETVSSTDSEHDPATVLSPRAAQPRSLRQTYDSSTDLFALDQDLRARADQGDDDAAMVLIDLENECRAFVLNGGTSAPGYDRFGIPDGWAKLHPDARNYVAALRVQEQSRCGRFAKTDFESHTVKLARLNKAAKNQNAEAKATLLADESMHWDTIPADHLASTVEDIVESGNARAIFGLSSVMYNPNRDQLFDVPAGSKLASEAYVLAACKLGMDCGPMSQLLANVCFNAGGCGYASYDAQLRELMLSPADMTTARQMADQIVEKTHHRP